LLEDPEYARQAIAGFSNSVAISALTGQGISDLLARINGVLYETFTPLVVRLPYQEGALIAAFHDQGQVGIEPPGRANPAIRAPGVAATW
jgi:GTP-binding protein HflX